MIYDTALCCIIGTLPMCLFAPLAFADDYPALQHTNIHMMCVQILYYRNTHCIYVVLYGVLALVVFADDSSDVN